MAFTLEFSCSVRVVYPSNLPIPASYGGVQAGIGHSYRRRVPRRVRYGQVGAQFSRGYNQAH